MLGLELLNIHSIYIYICVCILYNIHVRSAVCASRKPPVKAWIIAFYHKTPWSDISNLLAQTQPERIQVQAPVPREPVPSSAIE